jgi:hypothetical protein
MRLVISLDVVMDIQGDGKQRIEMREVDEREMGDQISFLVFDDSRITPTGFITTPRCQLPWAHDQLSNNTHVPPT